MTHKKIKRFQLEGVVADDSAFVRLKAQYVNMLFYNMRSHGYVPLLDVDPAWATSWNGESYDFVLTVHGVYYGMSTARKIYGVSDGKEVPME